MKFIDVRVRIPVNKMGSLVEEVLPEWATMIGYDRLAAQPERKHRTNGKGHGGDYKPGKGTAAEAVLRVLRPGVTWHRFEIIAKLAKTQKEKAVSSAIHGLAIKGLIVKDKDGRYERA
jgi:hypothetical protein